MAFFSEIDFGMIFKKMYCAYCGSKLKKEKVVEVFTKNDSEFKRVYLGKINIKEMTNISYRYRCPNCGELTNYNQQLQYRKEQKKARKKILFLNTKKSKNQKNKTK